MKNRIVVITGSPGAGKSTLMSKLKDHMPHNDLRYTNIGTLMTEAAKDEGVVEDRDKLRYLSAREMHALRHKAYLKLSLMGGDVVVDTHGWIEQHNRYVSGLPLEFVKMLGESLCGLVYIDADTEEIVRRRERDTTRVREGDDNRTIETQRHLNLSVMAYYASYLNVPIFIIHNKEGKMDEAAKELAGAVESLLSEKK
ncbi:MAG: AAA family ATPase [Candidatus Micrarchaeota archaeon]|nr:AAA family ATPase [Candidatus Micrarchaeota archaeon]